MYEYLVDVMCKSVAISTPLWFIVFPYQFVNMAAGTPKSFYLQFEKHIWKLGRMVLHITLCINFVFGYVMYL